MFQSRLFKNLMCLGAACVMVVGNAWAANQAPDANEMLKRVRQAATLQQNQDITGQIRKGRVKVPFTMSLRGEMVAFQYKIGDQTLRFDLKFKDKSQDIIAWDGKKSFKLPLDQYGKAIAGTDVTYEDLSMRFLYWPKAQIVQDEKAAKVKGRDCWIILIPNPNPKVGQYAWVRVWIDKENGAMWQIDGINDKGDLAKRFMLTSVMKLDDGAWFMKQMKIEVRDPKNSMKTIAVDFIDMNTP